jgi:hypothetical protein
VVLVSLLLSLIVVLPARGYAQEAAFTGAVTDSTGGVLPGVTVTATNVDSGNTFVAVTDDRGAYRLPVRVGGYGVKAELSGFTTVNRNVQVLVGQTAVVNVQMSPSAVQETVTVTGEAPLIDTTASTVGANIDPRQMQELPLNGRNWMDLTLLAPGARRNEAGGLVQFRQAYAQTNLDGQDVTSTWHSNTDLAQPSYNRDAIAEFEVIANRFDATQGRSAGMVVNAVTKSRMARRSSSGRGCRATCPTMQTTSRRAWGSTFASTIARCCAAATGSSSRLPPTTACSRPSRT